MTKQFTDHEFGDITVSYRAGMRSIRVSVGTDGRLHASAPKYTPLIAIKAMIEASRGKLRTLFQHHITPTAQYSNGQQIGKSHRLTVVPAPIGSKPTVRIQGQNIILRLPDGVDLESQDIQRLVRDTVIDALRVEAKAYLPRRLKELAQRGGYTYERVRFSHAGTRWGSRSSTGTISLNIALMKLPDTLIDYVICHELAHTRHMNHSAAFWEEVSTLDPLYKAHRKLIKMEHPII